MRAPVKEEAPKPINWVKRAWLDGTYDEAMIIWQVTGKMRGEQPVNRSAGTIFFIPGNWLTDYMRNHPEGNPSAPEQPDQLLGVYGDHHESNKIQTYPAKNLNVTDLDSPKNRQSALGWWERVFGTMGHYSDSQWEKPRKGTYYSGY